MLLMSNKVYVVRELYMKKKKQMLKVMWSWQEL